MPRDTIDYTKTAFDLEEAIRKMVEKFRKRKGHDPERLQVIAKQDTDEVAKAERCTVCGQAACGLASHKRIAKTGLYDMEFDEVSFVRRGANQEAQVVFWKSDEEDPPEAEDLEAEDLAKAEEEFWEWYYLEKSYPAAVAGLERQGWNEGTAFPGPTSIWRRLSEEQRNKLAQTILVGKSEDDVLQGLGKADTSTGVERGGAAVADETKQAESYVAATTTVTSRRLAEELAAKLKEWNPSLTSAQALARVYEANPQLYDGELTASDLLSWRQSQSTEDWFE